MSKFDTYFLMTTEDAVEYAKLKVPQMDWDAESMECKEIGDGNLNYVFKVTDGRNLSLILISQTSCLHSYRYRKNSRRTQGKGN